VAADRREEPACLVDRAEIDLVVDAGRRVDRQRDIALPDSA
jgi:hypothetical protein